MEQSQEERLNITIDLNPKFFQNLQGGIFQLVNAGKLTEIVRRVTEGGRKMNKNDLLALVLQRDQGGRTPIDLACHLNYKNITLFLLTKLGTPLEFVSKELDVDE